MDAHVMQRVLTPAQCAVLIVDVLPAAAVALPLAEAVAALQAGAHQEPQASYLIEHHDMRHTGWTCLSQ